MYGNIGNRVLHPPTSHWLQTYYSLRPSPSPPPLVPSGTARNSWQCCESVTLCNPLRELWLDGCWPELYPVCTGSIGLVHQNAPWEFLLAMYAIYYYAILRGLGGVVAL